MNETLSMAFFVRVRHDERHVDVQNRKCAMTSFENAISRVDWI